VAETRIGVIGAGWWAVKNHIPTLQSRNDVKVVAVCRLGSDELRKVKDEFGIEFATEDYRELLRRGDLDGVVISSPHRFHYEHATAALNQGLHVLCEKPMVLLASQARDLAALARSKQRHFLIPFGWNYAQIAGQARDVVKQGAIGKIEHIACHMGSATRDLFSGEDFWFSKTDDVKPDPSTWSDPAGGGGFAHGQLSHALALLFYITDLHAKEVFSYICSSKTGADLTDAISCRFTNGSTGMIGGAGTMPPKSTYQLDIRIFGTEGMLLLDIERPRLELRSRDGEQLIFHVDRKPGEYACAGPLYNFVDLIQGKEVENRSTADLGVAVVEVLDAALRSAGSGKSQRVADLD
jgi:predicted dehydrogenase